MTVISNDIWNKLVKSLDKREPENQKLTFEQWWESQVKETGYYDPWQDSYEAAKDAWKAAQENK